MVGFIRSSCTYFNFYVHKITELPAPWSRDLLEKSTIPQLVTELHTFYGT